MNPKPRSVTSRSILPVLVASVIRWFCPFLVSDGGRCRVGQASHNGIDCRAACRHDRAVGGAVERVQDFDNPAYTLILLIAQEVGNMQSQRPVLGGWLGDVVEVQVGSHLKNLGSAFRRASGGKPARQR